MNFRPNIIIFGVVGILISCLLTQMSIFPFVEGEELFQKEQTLKNDEEFGFLMAWSPDGKKIFSCGGNNRVFFIDPVDGGIINTICIPFPHQIIWSPNGKQLASISAEKFVRIWDVLNGTEVKNISVPDGCPSSIAWSPDGTKIGARVPETAIDILRVSDGKTLISLPLEVCIAGPGHLDWAPDSTRILDVATNHVLVFNTNTGKMIADLESFVSISEADWSPSGDRIVASVFDEKLAIYNSSTAIRTNPPGSNSSNIGEEVNVAWSPDGSRIASISRDSKLRFWNGEGNLLQALDLPKTEYPWGKISWSPDGKKIASLVRDIDVWGLEGPSLRISMEIAPNHMASGDTVNVTARVSDRVGNPVVGAEVIFHDLPGPISPVLDNGDGSYKAILTPWWRDNNLTDYEVHASARKNGVGSAVANAIITVTGYPEPPGRNNSIPQILNVSAANGSVFGTARPVRMSIKAYDADGDILTIAWYVNGTKTMGANYCETLGAGNYGVRVLVTDNKANIEMAFNISVVEGIGPAGSSNHAPRITSSTIADGDRLKSISSVFLSISATDEDSDNLEYAWLADGKVIGTSRELTYKFAPGNHTITVTVDDGIAQTNQTYHIIVESKKQPPQPTTVPAIGAPALLVAILIGLLRLRRNRR